MNQTKQGIVDGISKDLGMQKEEVHPIVQAVLDTITDALAAGNRIELRNFGIFEVVATEGRALRIPGKPGSEWKQPPTAQAKFTASKLLKQKIQPLTRTLEQSGPRRRKTVRERMVEAVTSQNP